MISVKVVERTELGVDIKVVLNVVLMVGGGGHHRREPDAVRAEIVALVRVAIVDIIELFDHAGDIADHVVVRIVERADPDLIVGTVFVG